MEREDEIVKWLKKISLQNGLLFKRIHEIEKNHKDVISKLEDFMLEYSSPQLEIHSFGFPNVWKTITIKSCPDKETFKSRLAEQEIQIVEDAENALSRPEYSIFLEKDLEADLVLVSVRELGFPKGSYLNSIRKKAKSEGLQTFVREVSPLLRLCCRKQPVEKIYIMSKSVKFFEEDDDDKTCPGIFCLTDDNVYESLDMENARPHAFYDPDDFLLFVKPRK